MISIVLDQPIVSAGDRISGHINYPDSPLPKQVTVELRWYTEGRGTPDKSTVDTLTRTPEEFDAGYPIAFSFDIPADSPVTYNGSLLRILWEVGVTMQYPGRRYRKDKAAEPFSVICRQVTAQL